MTIYKQGNALWVERSLWQSVRQERKLREGGNIVNRFWLLQSLSFILFSVKTPSIILAVLCQSKKRQGKHKVTSNFIPHYKNAKPCQSSLCDSKLLPDQYANALKWTANKILLRHCSLGLPLPYYLTAQRKMDIVYYFLKPRNTYY